MRSVLENGSLKVAIDSRGAELKSMIDLAKDREYIWSGDENYWGKTSPVLFPFVGSLKNGEFSYQGKKYQGSRHGFARENEFELVNQSKNSLSYKFISSTETLEKYPFKFEFYINYTLSEGELEIEYLIVNTDDKEIYFGLGAHPAFATPTSASKSFEDYYLEFAKEEESSIYQLDDGLLMKEKKPLLKGKKMPLARELFKNDAIIFDDLKSSKVSLKDGEDYSLELDYKGFPFLAFWNVIGADFLCIEPWYGVSDFVDFSGELPEKYGINKLAQGKEFKGKLKIKI